MLFPLCTLLWIFLCLLYFNVLETVQYKYDKFQRIRTTLLTTRSVVRSLLPTACTPFCAWPGWRLRLYAFTASAVDTANNYVLTYNPANKWSAFKSAFKSTSVLKVNKIQNSRPVVIGCNSTLQCGLVCCKVTWIWSDSVSWWHHYW